MSKQCSSGCIIKCSFGSLPSILNILPINGVITTTPAANILDQKPFVNILPFGTCSSPINPAVIASMGAPVPCTPTIVAPWFPGVINVTVGNMPTLNDLSKCLCLLGGIIGSSYAGQFVANL